jgi:DNA polymerase I-like protein with 3'-5' exonuclease and polymerase domains
VRKLIADLESDGLLDELSKIHCIALGDLDTGERKIYDTPELIDEALEIISAAEESIWHNGIAFDIPAIKKVYPKFKLQGKITDTLVLSRLICADLVNDDATSVALPEGFKRSMFGSHSLKAWGLRLGTYKGDYDGGWEHWSQEMSDYCLQDIHVTQSVYNHLMRKSEGFSQESINLEHELAQICDEVGQAGWTFHIQAAEELYATLATKRIDLEKRLETLFDPWEIHTEFIPKVNNKSRGYVAGEPFTKVKTVHFNPNSRKHIHYCLVQKYGWKPRAFTPSGEAKIDDSVMKQLPYPEAKILASFFLIQKRIAQLAEGKQAWLKLVGSDGKLRHTIVSGGTVSGRASARNPNLQQVVGSEAPYGKEMRSLFGVPPGWTLCGADLEQLELRMLAHFMPDTTYADQIMHGDIHEFNRISAGLKTRSEAKRYIYSSLYGGGDKLIGSIIGGSAKDGKRIKEEFDTKVPAFKTLKRQLQEALKRGHLFGLDGRKLWVRSEHKCLSQCLQSAGGLLAKKWLALAYAEIKRQGLQSKIIAWVHDEIQIACPTEKEAHHVGNILVRLSEEAGTSFGITKLPITSKYQIGKTWNDTH